MRTAGLTHRIQGEGPPVLLLNGGMMTYQAWEPVSSRLAERFRVVACDFRGQLMTPGPPPPRLEDHAADVARLLDELELPGVHLVGTSFGAEVGLLVAAAHPNQVRSLVVATASDLATESMRRATKRMRRVVAAIVAGGDRGTFHEVLVEGVFSPAHRRRMARDLESRRRRLDRLPSGWFANLDGLLAAVESFDLRPRLPAVTCPTLVVAAAGDEVMPPARSRALAAALPGAELVEHPASGHALVAEDPAWFADVCLAFLIRQSRLGSGVAAQR